MWTSCQPLKAWTAKGPDVINSVKLFGVLQCKYLIYVCWRFMRLSPLSFMLSLPLRCFSGHQCCIATYRPIAELLGLLSLFKRGNLCCFTRLWHISFTAFLPFSSIKAFVISIHHTKRPLSRRKIFLSFFNYSCPGVPVCSCVKGEAGTHCARHHSGKG